MPGSGQAIGDSLFGQVDGEFGIPGHAAMADAGQPLQGENRAGPGIAARLPRSSPTAPANRRRCFRRGAAVASDLEQLAITGTGRKRERRFSPLARGSAWKPILHPRSRRRQLGNRLMAKQHLRRQCQTVGGGRRHDFQSLNRRPAQVEEVVVNTDRFDVQHLLPDTHQAFFGFAVAGPSPNAVRTAPNPGPAIVPGRSCRRRSKARRRVA